MTTIDLDSFVLSPGSHSSIEEGACIMELAAYLAGQPFSDHPACVSPILGAFLRSWNDALADEPRQKLKPYAKRVLGTAGSHEADEKRAWLATDWLVRTCAPAFLDLAGLTAEAQAMRDLPELVDSETARSVQPTIRDGQKKAAAAGAAAWAAAGAAARDAARAAAWAAAWDAARDAAWAAAWAAAGDAARAAAWDAARDAAWAAAWAAAWDAAGDAAGDAARDAARAAARDAARDAARAKLAPTVADLQTSAFDLVDRMISVGETS